MKRYIWQKPNWSDFKLNAAEVMSPLAKVRRAQVEIITKMSTLDIKQEVEAQAEVLVEEAVRTSEIEGMALNKDAVRSSVAERLGLPYGIRIKDRHVDGVVEVLLDAIKNSDKPLTLERLNGWQAAFFPTGYSGMHKIITGRLRGDEPMRVVSGGAGKERIHYEAPPIKQAAADLKAFIKWWNSPPEDLDGMLRAAHAHLRFVTIHPYEDGNGRIARALTDMALAQDEKSKIRFYSVSSRIMKARKDYYDILERVTTCRADVTEWFVWFLDCVADAIGDSRRLVGHVLAKAEFWSRHARANFNDRQRKVLAKLLDVGPGGFVGGLTTRKYVAMTKASRATAFREISDMLEQKAIRRIGGSGGRSVSYEVAW